MSDAAARVLLIDDDEATFIITRELFDERYPGRFAFDWAGSYNEGWNVIQQARHDIYLIDQRLSGRNGIDLLRSAIESGCQAPIILWTGQDNRDMDVAAMQAGAADFLVKDVYDVSRLEHAMRYALERQRLVATIESERGLLRALMESIPDSVYFKDRESRFLRVSRALADRFGLVNRADAVGKTDADFFSEEHAKQARDDELELMATERPVIGKEEKETWPDGHVTWAATSKLPLRDPQGQIVGTFGISRDITEQKQMLLALKESEYRTRMIIETALDAFVAMDSHGTIIDWNEQAIRTFGWSHEEALGQSLADLIIPPRARSAHHAGIERYLATGEPRILGQRVELTALHRDGRTFPIEMTVSSLRFGERVLFAAFIHDITKRKAAESDLRQAMEAAEAANRAKSDFLANMSHEIRTPMNAIIGMTELVLDTTLTAAQREYLSMVRDSGESLLLLINDILDFSKIEAGKLDLVPDLFSLRETLGDTMKSLAVRAHRTNLELAFRVSADVPDSLIGDAGRLRQIVVNLVGNAIKFTQQGEVVLEVSRADAAHSTSPVASTVAFAESSSEPSLMLNFAVRDTGIGISPDKTAIIFEAFEQADKSTTRRYGGTGLGLSISRRLVELMGGRIKVESQVGVGSTFSFTARLTVASDAPASTAKPVVLNGTRVLIVDDNATNRRILEEMLRNWGLSPACADSAQQALECLREAQATRSPFAVVITDLHMPETDGFMLTDAIRNDPALARTLVLLLTSGDRPGNYARSQELGVSAYLLKPVKQSELFNALVRALGVNGTEDQTANVPSGQAALPPLRILLAEDSVANQRLAVGLLTKWGHHVTVANNGQEAVRDWAVPPDDRPFDVILMDVQMPEMDGLEATAEIRTREKSLGRHTPIVAMTAHAMKGDREQCLASGMDGYVAKPIRQQELMSVLQQVLPARLTPREVASPSGEAVGQERPEPTAQAIRRLDWEQALRTAGGDSGLLKEVMSAFLEEAPEIQERMRAAAAAGEWLDVGKGSHTLQAALRMFGGDSLDAAKSLEDCCKRGTPAECWPRFAKFLLELENVLSEVTDYLKGV